MPRFTETSGIAFLALFALIVASSCSNAITAQSAVVEASLTEVSKLIEVRGSLNWLEALPGHEYSSQITVSWAIPESALQGLASSEVVVYVEVEKRLGSQLYFKEGGEAVDTLYFNLTCRNANGSCGAGSVLSRDVAVYSELPYGGNVSPSNAVLVNASLEPFDDSAVRESNAESKAYSSASGSADYSGSKNTVLPGKSLDAGAAEADAEAGAGGNPSLGTRLASGFFELVSNPKGQILSIAILFFVGSALWFLSKRRRHSDGNVGDYRGRQENESDKFSIREDEWLK
jgi:hypothetical protein